MERKLNLLMSKLKNVFAQKSSLLLLICLTSSHVLVAQNSEIKGKVTEQGTGEPLPGVSIIIKGTTKGTITNFDGNYVLKATAGDILVFKYVGYLEEEVTISSETVVNMALVTDLVGLDEVVVIGYGVQKKKLNTGATVNVKGEDLQKLNTISPVDALKGNSAGVTITSNNGIPGSGNKVLIRGAGTMGDPSPLYVVDGVSVGNIDFLSPSDIESIDILKDAASTAIYGSRAANGVILVTTKKGAKNSKASITYDFYHGWQQIIKEPVLPNAQQFMEMTEEAYAYEGRDPRWERNIGDDWEDYRNGLNPGTNWFEEGYTKNAPTESHALSITGGNAKTNYSLGLSYLKQQGIIGYKERNHSTYERLNARINTQHVLVEHTGRNIVKIGENFSYSNFSRPNIATGGIYWNDFRTLLTTYPVLPMYSDEDTPEDYGKYHEELPWAAMVGNPISAMEYGRSYNENDNNNMVGNVYLEIQPINNLILKSSYGFDASFGSSRNYTPAFTRSVTSYRDNDNVNQSMYQNYTWTLSNTMSYNFNVQNIHNVSAMVGQEMRKNAKSLSMWSSNDSTQYNDWDHAYISLTHNNYSTSLSGMSGGDYKGYAMLSYFGRLSYDYNETLLATIVYRADASNNLAPGYQWGDFMSFSLGYILTNHDFMSSVPGLNYLKIRGGWGQNGNERIDPFQYNSSLEQAGGSYYFGMDKTATTTGAYPGITPNVAIGWETSEQTSIGFDANFLDNRLQFNFDWYNKTTKDWLVKVPKPLSNGTDAAIENGGAVKNTGVEIVLKWTETIGDFKYSIGGNFAYNKNEVTQLDVDGGAWDGNSNLLVQGSKPINRVEVGKPIGYFYGLETSGVIQEGEVYAIPDTLDASGNPVPFYSQMPGDLKFVDQNGDGVIDDEDKVMIGNPTPDVTFGINLSAEYKGAYLAVSANGALGHQNVMTKAYGDYDFDYWTPENPSNSQPRLTASAAHKNYLEASDYYIHDADYLRISNITLGYDINRLFKKSPLAEARLYVSGQNLFTFTKYPGLDPEVGYGGDVSWGSGVDLGLYPKTKTYMVGVSVKF